MPGKSKPERLSSSEATANLIRIFAKTIHGVDLDWEAEVVEKEREAREREEERRTGVRRRPRVVEF